MIKSLRKLFSTTYNKYIKIYFKWMLSIPRKKKHTKTNKWIQNMHIWKAGCY